MKSERIFYALILFLICSIIVNNRRIRMTIPDVNNDVAANRYWVVKTFIQKNYDIILLGDSRVYRGISPAMMEQSMPGFRILNFSYSVLTSADMIVTICTVLYTNCSQSSI